MSKEPNRNEPHAYVPSKKNRRFCVCGLHQKRGIHFATPKVEKKLGIRRVAMAKVSEPRDDLGRPIESDGFVTVYPPERMRVPAPDLITDWPASPGRPCGGGDCGHPCPKCGGAYGSHQVPDCVEYGGAFACACPAYVDAKPKSRPGCACSGLCICHWGKKE